MLFTFEKQMRIIYLFFANFQSIQPIQSTNVLMKAIYNPDILTSRTR